MFVEINNTGNFPVNKKFVQSVVDKCAHFLKIKKGELSIAFISNKDIKKWNKIYRKIDRPTDVLSFGSLLCNRGVSRLSKKSIGVILNPACGVKNPVVKRKNTGILRPPGARTQNDALFRQLDDSDSANTYAEILISYEMAKKQAKENKTTIKKEIERLLIHGILHLRGYDHEKDKDAEEMEEMEEQLLHSSLVRVGGQGVYFLKKLHINKFPSNKRGKRVCLKKS